MIVSWEPVGACTADRPVLALQDAIGIACRALELFDGVRTIGDQTAIGDEVAIGIDCRQTARERGYGGFWDIGHARRRSDEVRAVLEPIHRWFHEGADTGDLKQASDASKLSRLTRVRSLLDRIALRTCSPT